MFFQLSLISFVMFFVGCAHAQPHKAHGSGSKAAVVSALVAKPSFNDSISPKSTPHYARRCIAINMFKGSNIISDQSLRVTLKSGEQVNILLRDRCYGLAYDDMFYYQQNPTQQLCELTDSIIARSGSRCLIEKIETIKTGKNKKGFS